MADEADNAMNTMETLDKAALYTSLRDVPDVEATGECLYCGEVVMPPRRWCNAYCRDDWERENDAR